MLPKLKNKTSTIYGHMYIRSSKHTYYKHTYINISSSVTGKTIILIDGKNVMLGRIQTAFYVKTLAANFCLFIFEETQQPKRYKIAMLLLDRSHCVRVPHICMYACVSGQLRA